MRPYVLAETHWSAVREVSFQVAVLPWGATEAHNLHLPYSTDNIQLDFIAAESARIAWEAGAKVVVLPTVPFGVQTGQLDIPLDLNLMPSTQQRILGDLAQALSAQGIPKLVVLNGHGGNSFRQMIRETGARVPELFICEVNWFKALDPRPYFDDPGDHAGELETSLILHLAPDLALPLEQAGSGAARAFAVSGLREGLAWAERNWRAVTDDTGVGNPKAATAAKGERFFGDLTRRIGEFLHELAETPADALYET